MCQQMMDVIKKSIPITMLPAAIALMCLLASEVTFSAEAPQLNRPPNFVVIFIDDMGYGDIEPFGSTINKTPHLNQMAAEGMKLTSFYVAAPVCTPSRAALMTGCYPKRVGLAVGSVHSVLLAKDSHGLNPSEKTIAEVLKDAGYVTGCFGKWHLGDQPEFLPTNHGFDKFFGIPYSNDIWPHNLRRDRVVPAYPPLPVMRDGSVIDIVEDMSDQAQLCKRFTDEAVSFIKDNGDKPFFVYLPHASIHHPRSAPTEFLDRAGRERNLDQQKMASDHKYALSQRTRASIEEVDWSTGQILKCIRALGLDENTLVIFTSDNGPASGASSGPLRGNKGKTLEGGMREPTIAWWPGTIPANSTCDQVATAMDLLPTFAGLAGGNVPDDRIIDGKNIAALLRGEAGAKSPYKAFFYHRRGKLEAVRSGKWKLTTKGELYDLDNDIGERKNVASQNSNVVERLNSYLKASRADLDNPKNRRQVGRNANPKYLVQLPKSDASP